MNTHYATHIPILLTTYVDHNEPSNLICQPIATCDFYENHSPKWKRGGPPKPTTLVTHAALEDIAASDSSGSIHVGSTTHLRRR